jgi:hypothetical protein
VWRRGLAEIRAEGQTPEVLSLGSPMLLVGSDMILTVDFRGEGYGWIPGVPPPTPVRLNSR